MEQNNILFIDKINDNRDKFAHKLIEVSTNLNISPNWLMLIFFIETEASKTGVINHQARNPRTRATGLIQFMPATALSLGTSIDALFAMSNVSQLEYVKQYLRPYSHRIKRLVDCYLAVLFPAAIGKPANWVLEAKNLSAAKVAQFNPLYDLNKNGEITVGEVESKLLSFVPKGYKL